MVATRPQAVKRGRRAAPASRRWALHHRESRPPGETQHRQPDPRGRRIRADGAKDVHRCRPRLRRLGNACLCLSPRGLHPSHGDLPAPAKGRAMALGLVTIDCRGWRWARSTTKRVSGARNLRLPYAASHFSVMTPRNVARGSWRRHAAYDQKAMGARSDEQARYGEHRQQLDQRIRRTRVNRDGLVLPVPVCPSGLMSTRERVEWGMEWGMKKE